jgi:hypothetical protein
MVPGRKRRAVSSKETLCPTRLTQCQHVEASDSGSEAASQNDAPRNTQRRRRNAPVESDDEDDTQNGANDSTMLDGDVDGGAAGGDVDGSREQLVKKLVRYALACEFGRVPIRREGIREKGMSWCQRTLTHCADADVQCLASTVDGSSSKYSMLRSCSYRQSLAWR